MLIMWKFQIGDGPTWGDKVEVTDWPTKPTDEELAYVTTAISNTIKDTMVRELSKPTESA